MNFSALKAEVLRYLSPKDIPCDDRLDKMIDSDLCELSEMNGFRAVSAEYGERLGFLQKEPYSSFLDGSDGYFLIACTLGAEAERRIKRLSVTDMEHMVVYDACANAYLEYLAEEYKKSLAPVMSYTFCPGYGGSSAEDLKYILSELRAERIGLSLTDSFMMLPQKSIAGIIAKGVTPKMRCGDCAKKNNCAYRKDGKRCFRWK